MLNLRHFPVALLWISCFCPASDAVTSLLKWSMTFDNLTDYELLRSFSSESKVRCASIASRETDVQVATFNTSTGVCSAFRCRLGLSHCRKCRNVQPGNQLVWATNTSCWTTVQHRVSGSVDFYRNWSDYKAGFGEGPNGNFWIGLDTVYNLTVEQSRQLRFLMKPWNGSDIWAQYARFWIAPESDNYRLNRSGFSGSPGVGDSFASVNGYQFTTPDRDNDVYYRNCAVDFPGAWWFRNCFSAHPNGVYQEYPAALNCTPYQGIIWSNPYGNQYSLMEIEILIM